MVYYIECWLFGHSQERRRSTCFFSVNARNLMLDLSLRYTDVLCVWRSQLEYCLVSSFSIFFLYITSVSHSILSPSLVYYTHSFINSSGLTFPQQFQIILFNFLVYLASPSVYSSLRRLSPQSQKNKKNCQASSVQRSDFKLYLSGFVCTHPSIYLGVRPLTSVFLSSKVVLLDLHV